jgi:CRISPR-associated endonuclease/helicase Cas3
LCIVNTRKQAQQIFSLLQGDGVFHLSTTMYPEHRTRVLKEICTRLDKKKPLPCRVISTSMIEAGVDLDFPVVYREKTGLDSIVQAAGRCNREGKKPLEKSNVYVFCSSEHTSPKSMQAPIGAFEQVAISFTGDLSSLDAVRSYFQQLFYNKGEDALDSKGILSDIERGKNSFSIPFRDIADKLRIIEDGGKTVFVLNDAPELEKRLRNGERSRETFREAGKYSVSLNKNDINNLTAIGALEVLDNEVLLLYKRYYNDNYGVELSPTGGQALIV